MSKKEKKEENLEEEISLEEETEVKETKKEKKKKSVEEELAEYKEKYLYTLAELSNLGKTFQKEKESAIKYFAQDYMLELLPLYDIFTMVLENKNVPPEVENYLRGFELVYSQFQGFLDRNGVVEIKTSINEEYDPVKHSAIEVEEVEPGEENKIVHIYQKGYMYKDRVLRPTTVKVTKIKEEKTEEKENKGE